MTFMISLSLLFERLTLDALFLLRTLLFISFQLLSLIPLLPIFLPLFITLGLAWVFFDLRRKTRGYESLPFLQKVQRGDEFFQKHELETTDQLRSFLSSIKIFGIFDDPPLSNMIQNQQYLRLCPNQVIEDLDSAFYVVNKGEVHIYVGKELSEEQRIHRVHKGGTIISLYTILFEACDVPLVPCNVYAQSKEEAEVIRVPFEAFKELQKQNPHIFIQLAQIALTRFQRVTFFTMSNYFGLTSEFLNAGLSKPAEMSQGPIMPHDASEEEDLGAFVISKMASEIGFPEGILMSELIQFEDFQMGEILVNENEAGTKAFVVLEGEVEVSMLDHSRRPQIIKTAQFGEFVGHWSFIVGCPSLFQVKAKTSCKVASLTKKSFDVILEKTPKLWALISKKMLEQLSPLVRQIDFALEWEHFRAGQVLYHQGDEVDKISIVLNGRLRARMQKPGGGPDLVSEYTAGDALGDVDALTHSPRGSSAYAVRDTEIAKISRDLFYFLALRFPQVMIQISRNIALKSQSREDSNGPNEQQHKIKTVALLPISNSQHVPLDAFAQNLLHELNNIGPAIMIDGASVLQHLGKNALTPMGKLKLTSWLEEQEETHRIVLFKAGRAGTPWMERCVRQADCILLVAMADGNPDDFEIEEFLKASRNTVRKEIVFLHEKRSIAPGTTLKWLKDRPWIKMHHHILMPVGLGMRRQNTFQSMRIPLAELRHENQDFARLARHLTRRSVALVLGGGGARGMAHIGFLKALEEAGIPVDLIGGTSMGAFLGGLYARDLSTVSILGWALKFCAKMSSKWDILWDLTYPVAAWSTGKAFNRVMKSAFTDQQIEDLWLNYYCVTTNISKSRLEVHRSGTLWRYCRASMSLSGFLPPLCDQGDMLVDGGYINNLPVDVMKAFSGAKRIIAIDVAISGEPEPAHYGDSLSGWWVLLNRLNPFTTNVPIPTLADIQSRLAYVSSAKSLEEVKKLEGCIYLQPPIKHFDMLGFDQSNQILEVGYQFGKETIESWRKEGLFKEFLEVDSSVSNLGRRRNSR